MPRLTEQEQQEIIRFLETDKPLPDKFRFLLFEDKREVELVWNGKTSEVSNIVLPFQVIEQVDEPRTKKPNILEEIAYRDTWGKGADSFIAMIFGKLSDETEPRRRPAVTQPTGGSAAPTPAGPPRLKLKIKPPSPLPKGLFTGKPSKKRVIAPKAAAQERTQDEGDGSDENQAGF